jgi:hypothetical protein
MFQNLFPQRYRSCLWNAATSDFVSEDADTVSTLGKVSDRPADCNTWTDVSGVAYVESHSGLQCCVLWRSYRKSVNCETLSDGKVTFKERLRLAGCMSGRTPWGFHVVWYRSAMRLRGNLLPPSPRWQSAWCECWSNSNERVGCTGTSDGIWANRRYQEEDMACTDVAGIGRFAGIRNWLLRTLNVVITLRYIIASDFHYL